MFSMNRSVLILAVLLASLLILVLPALAQDPTSEALQTAWAGTPGLDETTPAPDVTPEPTLVGDPDEQPEIPSGLWTIFSGYYRDAVNQFTNAIRDVSLTQFGLLMTAFCILLIGFFKYVGPLIPKDALNILREASKDGLDVAKAELDRRHEEAKQTETPYDDAVVESLKLLHGAMTAIVTVTTSLAQAVAQLQNPVQPVAATAGLTEQELLDRDAFIQLNKPAPVVNIYTTAGADPEKIANEVRAALNPRDVARQEVEAAVSQANSALEMTEVDDLDFDDARG